MSGEVPEWPKGTDCKSVGVSLRRFETSPPHHFLLQIVEYGFYILIKSAIRNLQSIAGIAQLARAQAFQAWGRGFESRFPLHFFSEQSGVLVKRPVF
jgi:hypothetical protein